MAKRLTGRNALAYVGVEATTPANTVDSKVNPTSRDFRNFNVGDVWVNTESKQVWILADKDRDTGSWIEMASSSGVGASNFETDMGTATDLAGSISIVGGDLITTDALVANTVTVSLDNGTDGQIIIGSTAGSPAYGNLTSSGGTITITEGSNTLNIEADISGFAENYPTDSGTAQPLGGDLNIIGGGVLQTSGSSNTVTVEVSNGTNGQLLIAGGSEPQWASLTSTGGTITITPGANTLNIESSADGANDFVTDGGTATQALNSINILGGDLITTSGAGDTVTIDLDNGTDGQIIIGATGGSPAYANLTSSGGTITITNGANSINLEAAGGGSSGASQFDTDSGSANQAAGVIDILGGDLISTSGSGMAVTIDLDNGTDGQIIIGATAGSPAYANLTSTGGTITISNGPNSINLEASGGGSSGASEFITDSGTANQSAGELNVSGGTNINTSGSGNTVSIAVRNNPVFSGSCTVGGTGLTVSSGGITSTGTTTLSSLSAGVVQTNSSGVLSSSNGSNGEILIGGGTNAQWANLTSSDASIAITNGANSIDLTLGASVSGSTLTTFTSSGTWTKGAGTNWVTVIGWSGGGGGASGGTGNLGWGGGAGAAGNVFYWSGPASFFGATEPVVVGVGGAGAAAVSTDNTRGANGNLGTASSFGNIKPPANVFGYGLNTNLPPFGSSDVGGGRAPNIYTFANGLQTVFPSGAVSSAPTMLRGTTNAFDTVGAGQGSLGSAASDAPSIGGILGASFNNFSGTFRGLVGTGGGGGASPSFPTAGLGGALISIDGTTTIQAGATEGQDGADAPTSGGFIVGGFGGGGGGLTFKDGGNGGFPSGGGGGGAGVANGSTSGSGGNGGDGLVIVIEW